MSNDNEPLPEQAPSGQSGAPERDDQAPLDALYRDLRAMADRLMANERANHTLQPTALVHEAFLRLAQSKAGRATERLPFLAQCAAAMRRILIDHARGRGAVKRGGGWQRVTLQLVSDPSGQEQDVDLLALDAALEKLEALDPRQAKIVELRFFSGMSGEDIAQHLGVSRNTVVRELTVSRAWLQRELQRDA